MKKWLALLFCAFATHAQSVPSTIPPRISVIYMDGVKYPCSSVGIQAAVAAAGVNGAVHAEGCTGSIAWNSTVTFSLGAQTLYEPCSSSITFTTQVYRVASNGVHIYGCASGSQDGTGEINSGTVFTGASLGPTTDAVVVQSSSRNTLTDARLSDFRLNDTTFNMNNLGRRVVWCVSCWNPVLSHVFAYNLAGDGGVYIQAALSTDSTGAESYQGTMDHVVMQPSKGNRTTHAFYFDARYGEIGYWNFFFLRGDGPCCGKDHHGGNTPYYVLTGTADNDSFDQANFFNAHGGNADASAPYGVELIASGNALAQTGGRVFDVLFDNLQLENILLPTAGIGIGCNNGSKASGAGCGDISARLLVVGNFLTAIDYTNMGFSFSCISCYPNGSAGGFLSTGDYYANAPFVGSFASYSNLNATGNMENVPSFYSQPSAIRAGGFNGDNFYGFFSDFSHAAITGSPIVVSGFTAKTDIAKGNSADVYGFWCPNGDPVAGSKNDYCFEAGGGTGHFGTVSFAGAVSGNTRVMSAPTGSGTLTLPAATDTLTGRATTDTLTNKTLTTPAITKGIYSALPRCSTGTEGQIATVTDSTTNAWGASISGAGSYVVLGFCDGSNWTVAGK